jgi:plasmid stabilization system protein ParE
MNNVWLVQLTDMAEVDLIGIKIWTIEKFGAPQATKYSQPTCAAKRQQGTAFAGVQRSKKSNHSGFTIAARQHGFDTSLTRIVN